MAKRLIPAHMRFVDSAGAALSGGKLYFYKRDTSDAKDTFSDEALTSASTNPVVLDTQGRPSGDIWGIGDYKMVLTASTGTPASPIATYNPLSELVRAETTVSAVTELTAIDVSTLEDGALVRVAGGDERDGVFYWNGSATDTADGGIMVQPDAGGTGRWQRLYNGKIAAEWFGCKGDAATDNLLTLQTAIDTAAALQVGLKLGRGTFLSSGNLVLKSGATVEGAGYGTVLKASGPDVRMFQNENRTGPTVTDANIQVRNLRIDNTASGSTSEFSHCLDLRYIRDLTVENVWCHNAKGDGVYILSCEGFTIRDIKCDGIERQGVAVVDGTNFVIENIRARNHAKTIVDLEPNSGDTISNGVVRDVYSEDGSETQGVNIWNEGTRGDISNVLIQNIYGKKFKCRGVLNSTVSDIFVTSVAGDYTLEIFDNGNMQFNNINVLGSAIVNQKIKISSCNHCVWRGVNVEGSASASFSCFELLSSSHITIYDLHISNAGNNGIWWRDSDYCRFVNPVIEDDIANAVYFDGNAGTGNSYSRVEGLLTVNSTRALRLDAGTNGKIYLDGNIEGSTAKVSASGSSTHFIELGILEGYSTYYGSATVDPASVADGAEQTIEITVTGAAPGDYVEVWPPYGLGGLSMSADVNGSHNVRIVLSNQTGGATDLGSGVWRARVTKYWIEAT